MQLLKSDTSRVALLLLGIIVGHGTDGEVLSAQVHGSSTDSMTIMQAVANWERGWEIYDAELASRDYSDSADWTNAFGMRRIGRDSIHATLAAVFTISAVTAGVTQYEYHDLRFLSDTVALLRSRAIREGQQLADGTAEVRRINHLRVFARPAGQWKIVSHLIGDERTPGQAR
jgi:uncharacterized protein (TIGR02246 family)